MGLSKLLKAVDEGDLSSVKRLVEEGVDLKVLTISSNTVLHLAALKGFTPIMELLIDKDRTLLNAMNCNADTPLHQASSRANLAAVEVLVRAGANLHIKNQYGNSPLHLAAGEGYVASAESSVAIVELFINKNVPVHEVNTNGETPLHRAAFKGNAAAVAILVNAGADICAKNKIGNTPLHQAAAEGHLHVVEEFLELRNKKGDASYVCKQVPDMISVVNRNDETPLHRAALKGHASIVEALLKSGSNILAKNKSGNTPLHLAVSRRFVDVVQKMLLFQGSSGNLQECVNAGNNICQSPLHCAASDGHLKLVELLLDAGADVNAKQKDCNTPLHLATVKGHVAVMKCLLDKNPCLYNINSHGSTGAHHAAFNGNIEVLELLLEKGFSVNCKNRKENTLLHLAAREGHSQIVDLLFKYKADLNIHNKNGDSPVNLAARLGQSKIVLKLLRKGANPVSSGNGQSVLHAAAIGRRLHTIQLIARDCKDVVRQCLNKVWDECTEEEWANIVGCPHTAWWLYKQTEGTQQKRTGSNKCWKSCLERYEKSGSDIIRRAKIHDKREGDWLIKSIEDDEIEMHYMDKVGNTMLHVAAATSNHDTEMKLLEAGALSNACNHKNQKRWETNDMVNYRAPELPRIDKGNASGLYMVLLAIISQTVGLDDTDDANRPVADKTVQKKKLQAMRTVSKLLAYEIPLDPIGSCERHLLHLAITSNNRTLLPILLAAGVPLTTTDSGLGIVQLAWLTPELTTWVGMVVTRAVMHRLLVEQDTIIKESESNPSSSELKVLETGISALVQKLEGERPFEARWSETNDLTELLVIACKMGATMTAWYLWNAGGELYTRKNGYTALEAAVTEGKFSTAARLILDMGANPFVKDCKYKMPVDKFPDDGYILEVMLGQDYRCLDRIMAKTKDSSDTKELQQFIILLLVLYLQYKSKRNTQRWRSYFDLILEAHLRSDIDAGNWMCSLKSVLEEEGMRGRIVPRDADIAEEIAKIKGEYYLDDTTDDFYRLFNTLESNFGKDFVEADCSKHTDLLKRAFRITCELRLPLFLHLLVSITKQDVNVILNEACQTRSLHHAAKNGNTSAIVYLLDLDASLMFKDRGGLLPFHYAYMYGHKSTGDYLIKHMKRARKSVANGRDSNFDKKCPLRDYLQLLCSKHWGQECSDDKECDIENSSLSFWHSFEGYLKQYNLEPEYNANSRYLHVRNYEELLKDSLDRLEKKWKKNGIQGTVAASTVDFGDKEASEVQQAVTAFLKLLRNKIAEKNGLFKGELEFVGSSVDNVRLHCPDEYDCNLLLTDVTAHPNGGLKCCLSKADNRTRILTGHEKCVEIRAVKEELKEVIQESNFLSLFFELATSSLKEMDLADPRLKQLKLLVPGIKKTQVGVALSFLWLGTKYPMLFVDVDLVPTFRAPCPSDLCPPHWVIQHTDSNLEEVFVNSIGKNNWRFSFGSLETKIMQKLTEKQRKVFLACKMILSVFKTESWVPRNIKSKFMYWDSQMFTHSSKGGFALKNSFIRELKEVTDAQEWESKNLLKRMHSVFSRMCNVDAEPGIDGGKNVIGPKAVKAYFGGEFETAAMYLIAPEILKFLESLSDSIIDK